MAKRKKKRRTDQRIRNWIAVSAHLATGAGSHADRRRRRKRTRSAERRAAINDF